MWNSEMWEDMNKQKGLKLKSLEHNSKKKLISGRKNVTKL